MNSEANPGNTNKISKSALIKFLICSSLGVFLFLIPIKYQDTFNIPIGIVIDFVKDLLGSFVVYFVIAITSLNAILSLWANIAKPKSVMENKWLKSLLITTPLYLISRIIGAIFVILINFKIGPEAIISDSTGGTMLGISTSLVSIIFVISYLMPLLTDFGIMEFLGVLIRDFVKPLFTVPGRSAIDLITSWLGAANAAALLTRNQYDTGYYTAREAAVITTNFSLVSVPFCYIVASILGIENMFTPFYIITTVVGFILAAITPRIAPLRKLPDTYNPKTGKMVNEEVPKGKTKFQWALESATKRAESASLTKVVRSGNEMLTSVLFNLTPIIIAWGTLSLILVEYTSIFKYLSYPLGYYLNLFGIEQAFEVAPATLVGFADMFIPAMILAPVNAVRTKFIVGSLSLVQIIYMTEVGTIVLQSDVPLGLKELFIIFLERTVIAIPLIVLFSSFVF